MSKAITDVVRRVWDMDELKALEVLPDPENTGWVVIQNFDKDSIEWFGTIKINLPTAFAKQLGQAIIDCVGDLETQKTL